jgi:hypothetical protein
MKSKEEIEQLAEKAYPIKKDLYRDLWNENNAYVKGYTQCQEDMDDNMVKLANYLRNNYQPLAPNQAEWQRIKDKKVLRIEDIINSLNKHD